MKLNNYCRISLKFFVVLLSLFIWASGSRAQTMLFLHGMQSRYGNVKPSQVETYAQIYATKRGYKFEAIPISGDNTLAQRKAAIARIQKGGISALYGFSAGGYNIKHVLNGLSPKDRETIKDVTILGSPGERPIKGITTHIIGNPPQGHMQGPRVLSERPIE